MTVEFTVLGSVELQTVGGSADVGHAKQRAVLAVLLLELGRAVPATTLIDRVWGEDPPASVRNLLYGYAGKLRAVIGAAGDPDVKLVRCSGGYQVQAREDQLDLRRFRSLVAAAAHDSERAEGLLREALGLWRGTALAGLNSPWLNQAAASLELERAAAVLDLNDIRLQHGQHAALVSELAGLAVAAPDDERLTGQLMLALYRSGQQAEALRWFDKTGKYLTSELGIDPGPSLKALHHRILNSDPSLAITGASTDVHQPKPRQLPAAVRKFTGRADELAVLSELLTREPGASGVTAIAAIGGTAGIGKTTLAVEWAHRAAGRFPDGQLYVNLRGYDPGQPVSVTDALAGFLRTLGVPGQEIPDEAEDQARLYRSRLAGRRMLVLLDNARDAEQVRPLLPGDPGCIAVVTSRDALIGLAVIDGASRLDLDLLPQADAITLLRSLIGSRADADPAAVAELAELCGRLPLALRIAAELVSTRASAALAELAAELAAAHLDGLDAGEARADARTVFSWSIRRLPDRVAGAFALAGLHPGADLDVYAAAALTRTSIGQGRRLLLQLHQASLVQAGGPGRYGMHDLLRAYAREQATALYTSGECRKALSRLFDYYLVAAAAAMDILFPAETHLRRVAAPTAAVVPVMHAVAEARAWLDAERANLVAVIAHCADHGWPQYATGLAGTLFSYLMTGSHLSEARAIYSYALEAARRSGDLAGEAEAQNGLGGIGVMKGRFHDAAGHYQAAFECYRTCGDRTGQARVLRNLGVTEQQLHNHRSAASYHRQALAAYEEVGDTLSAARVLVNLAGAETELGYYHEADEHVQRALPVFREAKALAYEAEALEVIGDIGMRNGQLTQAAHSYGQALPIWRRIGHRSGEAGEMCNLGKVALRQGQYREATSYLRQALTLFREVGHLHGETETLLSLAEALHRSGQPAAARTELTAAVQMAAETGNTYQQEQALILHTQLVDANDADKIRSRFSGP